MDFYSFSEGCHWVSDKRRGVEGGDLKPVYTKIAPDARFEDVWQTRAEDTTKKRFIWFKTHLTEVQE